MPCIKCRQVVFTFTSRARAFTLLELFLVIGILVGLSAIIWPALSARSKIERLNYAARRLESLLLLARNGAMANSARYRCVFESNGTKVRIEEESDPTEKPGVFSPLKSHWSIIDLGEDKIRCLSVKLDDWQQAMREHEIEITEQEVGDEKFPPIEFFPDGRMDSVTIEIGDDENNTISIEINGLTGKAKQTTGFGL